MAEWKDDLVTFKIHPDHRDWAELEQSRLKIRGKKKLTQAGLFAIMRDAYSNSGTDQYNSYKEPVLSSANENEILYTVQEILKEIKDLRILLGADNEPKGKGGPDKAGRGRRGKFPPSDELRRAREIIARYRGSQADTGDVAAPIHKKKQGA